MNDGRDWTLNYFTEETPDGDTVVPFVLRETATHAAAEAERVTGRPMQVERDAIGWHYKPADGES